MSSIWDNTYTLGNSSATVISAGPGIKIDDSTPGVIKVSNDETVLFEYTGTGKNTASAFDVAEPITNFETIRIRCVGYPGNDGQLVYCDIPSPRTTAENISICTTYFCSKNDGNPLQVIGQRYSASNNGLTYNLIDKKMLYYALTATAPTSTNANILSIDKIVGINRKQNGGN